MERLVFFLMIGLLGCKHAPVDDAGVKHSVNKPLQYYAKWNYLTVDEAEFSRLVTNDPFFRGTNFLPRTNDLAQRLQFWVHLIHQSVVKAMPEQSKFVPEPVVNLAASSNLAAFSIPVYACVKTKVIINERAAPNQTVPGAAYFTSNMGLAAINGTPPACVEVSDVAVLQSFVQSINQRKTSCQLRYDQIKNELHLQNCSTDPALASVYAADKFYFYTNSNHIVVFLGFFKGYEEDELISVIAHELGHYYRSHATHFPGDYEYFYTLGMRNESDKPKPNPALTASGQRAQKASTYLAAHDYLTKIPGQKLDSKLYYLTGSLLQENAGSLGTYPACRTALDLMRDQTFQNAMKYFPAGYAPNQDVISRYMSFENAALSCLANLDVSISQMQKLLATSSYSPWFASPEQGGWRNAANDHIKILNQAVDLSKIPSRKSDQFLIEMTKQLDATQTDAVALLKYSYDSHLAFYTTEQEADEVGAEFLRNIGIDPRAAIRGLRKSAFNPNTGLGGYYMSAADCDLLIKNNWRDAHQNYVYAPIGDYNWQHHSVCYRMFNISREITTHNYRSGSQTTVPPGKSWRELQAQAEKLIANPSAATQLSEDDSSKTETTSAIRDEAKKCIFADLPFIQIFEK